MSGAGLPGDGAWLPEVTVHRLRGPGTSDLRARVQALSLTPPGLPPEAVLCIRQLTTRPPGHLTRDPAAWQAAALDQLSALHRRAVRPLWEPVPSTAQAVLFDHPADLLSGLALAWRRGELQRWWWAGLYTPAQLANPAVLWQGALQWLPRLLGTLARHGEARAFVQALGPAQAEALLRALLDHFGLDARPWAASGRVAGPSAGASPRPAGTAELTSTDRTGRGHSHPDTSANPWAGDWCVVLPGWSTEQQGALLPECPERPAGPADWLLGLGLLLHRAPALLRAGILSDHRAGTWTDRLPSPDGPERLPPDERTAWQSEGTNDQPLNASPVPTADPDTDVPRDAPASRRAADARQVTRAERPARSSAQTTPGLPPALAEPTRLSRPALSAAPTRLVSACGGVLYLLNVATQMRLSPDFIQPFPPQSGLGLSPWTLLALIGERWLGVTFTADPLADLLADLSDQQADLRAFTPPAEWRFPAHWLRAFPEEAVCLWTWTDHRLLLRHPAGFWLYDAECSDPAAVLDTFSHLHCRPGSEPETTPSDPFERWLTRLSAAWTARLERALGPGGALLLCRQSARIERRAEGLVATFDLASHPLDVRLAGLDRDPGWIATAGLNVSFRYES